jgi:hypothetical protein
MKHEFKMMFGEKLVDQLGVGNGTFHKLHPGWNMVAKTTAQIIQTDHLVPLTDQVTTNMGPDEPGRAGY